MKSITPSLYWKATSPMIRNAVVPEDYRFLDSYILKAHRQVHDHALWSAREARQQRIQFLRDLTALAEDGKIAVLESGMDCDGVQYAGKVRIVDATKEAVQAHIDHTLNWADGPCYFSLERPSVANDIQYRSRDRTLEAFEDGHAHSITYGII